MKAAIRRKIAEVLSSNGRKAMARQFRLATAGNLDDVLDDLMDMALESLYPDSYSDLRGDIEVTREVKQEAAKFEKACEKALEEWVKKNPLKDEYDASDLMDEDGPYNVLMTLRGEGVGIWDGRWDHFFNDEKEIKELEKFLDRKLGKFADDTGGGSLHTAIYNALYDQFGEELEEASVQASSQKQEVIKALIKAGKKDLANKYAGTKTHAAGLDAKKIKEALTIVHHNEKKEGRDKAAKRVARMLALSPEETEILFNALHVKASKVHASGWEDQAMADLAEDQGWDLEEVEWEDAKYQARNEAILITYGREEYLVFEDYNTAEREAMEQVQESLEEDPTMFNRDWLINHVYVSDVDARLVAGDMADMRTESLREDAMREDYDYLMKESGMEAKFDSLVSSIESAEEKISDFEDDIESGKEEMEALNESLKMLNAKDPKFKKLTQQHDKIKKSIDKMEKDLVRYRKSLPKMESAKEKMVEDAIEAVHDNIYDEVQKAIKDDPIRWIEDEGIYDLSRGDWPDFIRIDYDSAAEDAVNTDGVSHFLASYDGHEIELDNGAYAYRIN